jgi:ATP-dependent Clp protease protease subunit
MREELNRILVHHTGQSMEKIQRATDRDFFLTAAQAKEYRIVNEVIASRPTTRPDREGAVTVGRADVLILPQELARRAKLIAGLTGYDFV